MQRKLKSSVFTYTVSHNENGRVVINQCDGRSEHIIVIDDEAAAKLAQAISEVAADSRTFRMKQESR